jgi:hypothetical protein
MPKTWTVIGFWDDDEIRVAGVVEGAHTVYGGDDITEEGPWARVFEAETYEEAQAMAERIRWINGEAVDPSAVNV